MEEDEIVTAPDGAGVDVAEVWPDELPNPRRCETCRHWDRNIEDGTGADGEHVPIPTAWGSCRRFPPQMVPRPEPRRGPELGRWVSWMQTHHVETHQTDTCGEWAPRGSLAVTSTARRMALDVLQGDGASARALADLLCEQNIEGGQS